MCGKIYPITIYGTEIEGITCDECNGSKNRVTTDGIIHEIITHWITHSRLERNALLEIEQELIKNIKKEFELCYNFTSDRIMINTLSEKITGEKIELAK